MWYLIVSIPDLCTLTYFVDCKLDKSPSSHLLAYLTFLLIDSAEQPF